LGSLSPQHSTSLSSPYSQRSLRVPLSPLSSNPRWAKQFKLIKKSIDHGKRPDTFASRSRAGTAYIPLAVVDTTVGKGECLAQTAKQWDTIVKQAKADDKVSDDMKAAKFFRFGHVLRDPKPAKPSEAYVFARRLSESEAKEQVDGLPLPLKAYAAERREKIRRRPRPGLVPLGSDGCEPQPTVSNSIKPPTGQLIGTPAGVHGVRGDSNAQASNVSFQNCYHSVISNSICSAQSSEKVQERP
jgi:hypothetical protein